ncbi:hypothetical protein FOZ63_004604, partial [Perkinsus olseni]
SRVEPPAESASSTAPADPPAAGASVSIARRDSGPSASASTLQTSPFVDHSVSLPGEEGVPAAAPRRQPRYKARREVAQQPDTSAGQG